MDDAEVIVDKTVFLSLRSESNELVDHAKRLPDFVFRRLFARYYAVEYGYVERETFGRLLSRIAHILGDETINYMVLDPDPADYYNDEGFYGLVRFRASTLAERYVPVLGVRGSSRLFAGANVGMLWGASQKWAIMCDRISWELAVIAVPENVDVSTITDIRCMDSKLLLQYIRSQYHVKDPSDSIASNFTTKFLAMYPPFTLKG